jgi:hypothetical protein
VKPKKEKREKINKKTLIKNLLNVPPKSDKTFWAKEFKLLNDILFDFPDEKFWKKIQDNIVVLQKVPSLAIHLSQNNQKITEKYKLHLYEVDFQNPKYFIGEKQGHDYHANKKPKTIKQFLS